MELNKQYAAIAEMMGKCGHRNIALEIHQEGGYSETRAVVLNAEVDICQDCGEEVHDPYIPTTDELLELGKKVLPVNLSLTTILQVRGDCWVVPNPSKQFGEPLSIVNKSLAKVLMEAILRASGKWEDSNK